MNGLVAAAGLAVRRLRAAPGRWLAVAAIVALAVALQGALSAAGVVAGDHAARAQLARLGPLDRTARLVWSGGVRADQPREATHALAEMRGRPVTRGILLYPNDFGRALVQLAAADPLASSAHVVSGRMPVGGCTAGRCEVLWAGGRAPISNTLVSRGVHLVIVGRGVVTNQAAFGIATREFGFDVQGASKRPTLLVGADPAGVDALHELDSVTRAQTWSAPLPVTALHSWELNDEVDRIVAARGTVERIGGFTATTPQAALQAAKARADSAPGRLSAAGATAAAALAALLALAAGALRGGLLAEDGRLRRAGATVVQRAGLAATETALPVLAGLLAGIALAALAAWLRARAGGVDAGHVLSHAAAGALGRAAVTGGIAWALVLVCARAPVAAARVLAAAALVAAAALLAGVLAPRGTGASDPLPGTIIPVAAAAAGLLVGLLLPPLLQRVARAAPKRWRVSRVALLELARQPGAAAIAAAGLTVSVGLAGFAFAYHATIDRSRADQANHRVPLAATVLPGPDLRSPLAVLPAKAWQAMPGVAGAAPVVRRDAFALEGPTRDPIALLGVPADVLSSLHAWRAADAAGDRAALARRLVAPPFDRPSGGLRLPAAARTVALPARADGENVHIALLVRASGGFLDRVALGTATRAGRTLRAALPGRLRGGLAVGLLLSESESLVAVTGHQEAEGGSGTSASGVLHLGALRAGSASTTFATWHPHGSLRGPPSALRYRLAGTAVLRADQPSDHAPVPVLADPATARDAALAKGTTIEVLGVDIRAKVVGVVRRFPTVPSGQRLVLADATALAGALDAQDPGSGQPRELWLTAQRGDEDGLDAAVAEAGRTHALVVRTHAATRRAIDAEPIAREVLGALTAAALLAAALAIAGVAVAIRRAVQDGSAALVDLEAQGLGPRVLRRGLRLRAAAIAAAGTVPGVALGLVLTTLVTSAVRAGATGPPDPPLVLVVPWASGALAALALLAAAVGAGSLAASAALREPVPRRALAEEPA
jgi:hypothetical protein